MIQLINTCERKIAALCHTFHVAKLEVFGSAAVEARFDEDRSDIDFLVEFLPGQSLGPWLGRYFAFKESLEDVLGRRVDLVMPGAMRNPYLIREVNKSRTLLYAA